MKKLITVLCLMIALAGCAPISKDDENKKVEFGIQILKKRGCEYVVYKDQGRSSVTMVHAGDCQNPAHIPMPLYRVEENGRITFFDQSGTPSANQGLEWANEILKSQNPDETGA